MINGSTRGGTSERPVRRPISSRLYPVFHELSLGSLAPADNSATQLRTKQDEWCKIGSANKEPFPEDLEWEALADVLRGKVKVNVHCYETVDFDQLVSFPGCSLCSTCQTVC